MSVGPKAESEAPHPALHTSFLSGFQRIDARWHVPQGSVLAVMVVAHPHPAHGGHMDHPVVVATAAEAARLGIAALRFDFRGVRGSEGDVADFEGHLEDWRSAVADARRRVAGVPVLGAGFSYGARSMAWLLRGDADRPLGLSGQLLLAPATRVPTTRRDFGALLLGRPLSEAALDVHVLGNLRALPAPSEVLVGSADVVAPPPELRANLPAHARLTVLEGLNHFFHAGTGAGPLDVARFGPALSGALRRLLDAASTKQTDG